MNEFSNMTTQTPIKMTTEEILSKLTIEQKISLLSGESYWTSQSIPDYGVKSIKFSDGPNGVRGESIHAAVKAYCFPCGTCVGASFNTSLAFRMGNALGRSCKAKNVGCILGPTLNLHRSPLGGRNFESYSEDPTLSGLMAAEYVNGVQSQGVAASPKHFVGNECEKERKVSNTIVDEKTLRELYAYAFQLVFKHSTPMVLMASYNKINGVSMSENRDLLQGLVRGEWGYKGIFISDWEGVYSQTPSVLSGLHIEFPGPPAQRGAGLVEAAKSGVIPASLIDDLTSGILELSSKIGREDPSLPEKHLTDPESEALMREIATEGLVLLKNKNRVLPLDPSAKPKIAVFGTPAQTPIIHGGGSASLTASYISSPLVAFEKVYGKENVSFHPGVPIFRKIPSAPLSSMKTVSSETPGVDCYWYNGDKIGSKEVKRETLETTRTLVIDNRIKELEYSHCTKMEFFLTPQTSGTHTFGITSNGPTTLYLNDQNILHHEGFTDTKVEYIMQPGNFEVRSSIPMSANTPYYIRIESHSTRAPLDETMPYFNIPPQATQVGFYENLNTPQSSEIIKIAADSDVSFVFTGNNKEYESESFDRDSLFLSCPQEALIRTVAQNSAKVVVVNETGSPILMDWLDQVDGVVQAWFSGQEIGSALLDLISGKEDFSGKLPVTFPKKIEESSSFGNFPTDDDLNIEYKEGTEMGYRARKFEPLFPFGFGLSYTSFSVISMDLEGTDLDLNVVLDVRNDGKTDGKFVAQIYVDGILKGFNKTVIAGDATTHVEVKLDRDAFGEWSVEKKRWIARKGSFEISARSDANTVLLSKKWTVGKEFTWVGL